MSGLRKELSEKIIEKEKEFKGAIEEKQRLVDLNREECFKDINKFLLDNLGDIDFEVMRSTRHDDWVVFVSKEGDTEEMTEFISMCQEKYNYDPSMFWTHFSVHLYDDNIEIYAKDKYSHLRITVRDMSILNDFIEEYNINKLSLGNIEKSISEYEHNLEQLKSLKSKFT